ncbi:hypothetical protein M433DRAFT_496612 [Acidomyces richmondensis BFW]|nr:MAG: hypothetical protein FE78DRAFT_301231 [Acidomyces sp. 'richmondensis']KYG47398.1 hypothetical protein M433DRAFT_496612 [Acidomyces richmondensis BFW]
MTWFQLSEETKVRSTERITRVIDFSRVAIHYGYLPLIIYLGWHCACTIGQLVRKMQVRVGLIQARDQWQSVAGRGGVCNRMYSQHHWVSSIIMWWQGGHT